METMRITVLIEREIDYRFRGQNRGCTVEFEAVIGGPYVEINFADSGASEVINVWNYGSGRSEFTAPEQLDGIVDAWIADRDSESLEDSGDAREWVAPYLQNQGILPY